MWTPSPAAADSSPCPPKMCIRDRLGVLYSAYLREKEVLYTTYLFDEEVNIDLI